MIWEIRKEEKQKAYREFNYLSFLAFWVKALNLEAFWTASFFLSCKRLWRDSPRGLFARAFTAVNGIAENTSTPASFTQNPKKGKNLRSRTISHQRETNEGAENTHLLPGGFAGRRGRGGGVVLLLPKLEAGDCSEASQKRRRRRWRWRWRTRGRRKRKTKRVWLNHRHWCALWSSFFI